MSADLSPECREEAEQALLGNGSGVGVVWTRAETEPILDALAPLIAGWLAAERETGAAEVRGKVEAVNFTDRRLGMAHADPWREGWNHALDVCLDDLRAALRETP